MGQRIVLVVDGVHDRELFFSFIIPLLHFPIHLHVKGCFSLRFPPFSNDKNWRPFGSTLEGTAHGG